MTDIVSFVSENSTSVMVGAGAGIVAAKVLHLLERVKRLVLWAITMAAIGGTGAGAGSNILTSLASLK